MIKNLMDKLQNKEIAGGAVQLPAVPAVPNSAVPVSAVHAATAAAPVLVNTIKSPTINQFQKHASYSKETNGGRKTMQDNEEGIIIDLGEGISLNVPIQKRMSLGDFLKVAEKVKALEMLSEEVEYKKNY